MSTNIDKLRSDSPEERAMTTQHYDDCALHRAVQMVELLRKDASVCCGG